MKKKFTTIVLALLMTMMFATAGVFAAPEDNDAEKSDYWKVEVTKEADSPAVIVWSTADKDYEHKADAVFNIYRLKDDGDKELIAENVMSKSAAAKVENEESEDEPLVYVYNDKEDAKDKDGKAIPLGYSYSADDLDLDADSAVIVEKVDEEKTDEDKTDETKPDGKSEGTKEENGSADTDASKLKSGDTKLNTAAANYTLSNGRVSNVTDTTAVFTWDISPEFTTGQVTINGRKINPTKNDSGTYSFKVTGFDPAHGNYSIPVVVVDNSGKAISNILNFTVNTGYQLSAGGVTSQTRNTAVFTWRMNRGVTDGSRVTINGRVINPKNNGDGTYSFNVSGFDPGKTYVIPIRVVKNGKTVSNVLNVGVYPYYCIGQGKVASSTSTAATLNWKSHRPLEAGDKVSINGRTVTPTRNSDGSYSFTATGFDPAHGNYSIPVKFVDKNGKAVSNVINITVNTGYRLSAGGVTGQTRNTAVFTWRMNRAPDAGARVTINGRVVNPKNNGDGTYSFTVTGFDPGKTYVIPVKVINKNGKVASNVLNIGVYPYYCIGNGKVSGQTPTTATLNWKSHRPLEAGDKVSINGRAVNPTKNSDGSYSFTATGFDPARSYSIPVKIVDSKGKAVSNVINIGVGTYYQLSAGKVASKSGSTALFNWRMNRELADGAKVSINGHPVVPTKNSDGSYSFNVTGFTSGNIYNIPVKVIDKNGRTISNTINIVVDMWGGTIRTMQVQFTFSENRTLTSYTGGSVTTYFKAGYTTTCTGFENGRYQFYYNGRMYYVNRLSTTNQKIVSSAFDKTYSGAIATNYVNSLGISSNTNYLIWVNTYTQKMYIFYGSRNNWRLVQGPWVVSTGKPTTMTSTGLAQIRQKDYYDRNLYYWNVVSYFSIHGKVSEWVLGYPRSDGCVRNTDDHASYVYYNCPIGTAVYVY